MVKISDKINSLNQQKLIKIYRNIEFYRAEMNGLEEKYQAIVDRKLNAFLRKGNKKLSKGIERRRYHSKKRERR
jgi:hypothetical protein